MCAFVRFQVTNGATANFELRQIEIAVGPVSGIPDPEFVLIAIHDLSLSAKST
ncbi:hypothetical protein SAMN04489740_0840 [Arthrobacter alpinus]|uniref:Uncharacterized protein n=1 Tax=Arthrobacter alpinus TaxID=656366 RepID=A0A1H5GSP8_9MICC|nr:hypothetical protein SAMN04489740_0840 [Arthrobacter alpinus]